MAIVEKRSGLIHKHGDPNSTPPDPQNAAGRIVVANSEVENAADDSAGSTYHLVDIPSQAILLPETFFAVSGDGFAQIQIGTYSDTVALLDVAKSAAAIQSPIAQGDVNHGKQLWEVLGLSKDPRGKIPIYKHAAADATGAGKTKFCIYYLMP